MSEQTKVQLSSKSLDLIPADYVQNVPLSTDSCNSDVEPEPEFEMWPELPEGEVVKYFGPPTREVGFTQKEEQEWEKAHEKMAERDWARELVEKWPAHSRKDNIRPKGYESPPTARRNRVFPKKSEEEQKRLNDMVDVVVVLTPSVSYLDRLQNPPPKPKKKSYEADVEPDDNMLAVCVYVPCTRGWYKITELNTTCIKNAFGDNVSSSSGGGRSGASSWDDPFRDDFNDDDEEEQKMMMMMDDMYTFNEEPHSYRMMNELSRPRMPQSTSLADKKWKIPSLADKKWKVQYYMDKLFFFHEKLLFCVYINDLLTKEWKQTHVDNRSAKPERSYVELLDGLDLIVLNKDTMYAVQRIALIEKHQQQYSPKYYYGMVHSQTLKVKHIVYKLVEDGEKKDMRWEWHMDTDKHFVHIVWDRDYQRNIKKDDNRMAPLMALYQNRSPRLRKPNCLETALFAEDPFKLDIVYMTHDGYNNYASNIKSACAIEACYLDTKKTEELPVSGGHNSFMFGRTVTPLVSSDYCIFTSDLLEPVASIDIAHGSNMSSWLREPDYPSAFSPYLKALEQYPRCSTIMCSAKDGKRLWILRGKEDDSSELIEVQIKCWRQVCLNRSEYVQTPHTPPPFKCFTMATTGSMDIARLKDFGLPMKYMHDRLNVL